MSRFLNHLSLLSTSFNLQTSLTEAIYFIEYVLS